MIRREEILGRFYEKCVDVPIAGCRIWLGTVNEHGYGTVRVSGKAIKAHRFAWEAENGDIPAGKKVLHKCDVRCCVNPHHLFLGTQSENMADMAAKGRARGGSPRGERQGASKLTAAQVREIRRIANFRSHQEIADSFGIHRSNVGLIVNRKSWSHVD